MPKENCSFSGKRGKYLSTVFIQLFIAAAITFAVNGPWDSIAAQAQEGGNVVRKPVKRPAQKPEIKEKKKASVEAESSKTKEGEKQKEDYEEEVVKLNEMIKADGENADLFYNRGCLFASQGKRAKALKDYNRAIEIDKNHSDAYFNRGLLYAKMERYEMAVRDFGEVIRLNPKAYDALCNRGAAYYGLKKYQRAIEDFTAAIEITPNDPDLYKNRSFAYSALGENKKADEDMRKAAQLSEKEAEAEKLLDTRDFVGKESKEGSLKKAALDCNIEPFIKYFNQETRARVQRFEVLRLKIQEAFDGLFNKSKELFGDKVKREGDILKFEIKGEDPRWTDLLGPQWEKMKNARPGEPRFFIVRITFGWSEECSVLNSFQACMEDPKFCSKKTVEGSAIQIRKVNGSWKLVSDKKRQEWEQAFRVGETLENILKWAQSHIAGKSNQLPYEELMLSLAQGYFQRISSVSL